MNNSAIATNLKKQIHLFEWYIEIVRAMPSANNQLFDLEADYADSALIAFLANSADFVQEDENFRRTLIRIVENHVGYLKKSVEHQEYLFELLSSSLDTQLLRLLEGFKWTVSGDENRIQLLDSEERSIIFELSDHGYQIMSALKGSKSLSKVPDQTMYALLKSFFAPGPL